MQEILIKSKDLEEITQEKVNKELKDKFDLLLTVLDKMYLTEDNYSNDIYLRDDVVKAMEEVLYGSYKEHETCYNCKKNKNCKYINHCKRANPLIASDKDYFEGLD